MDLRAVQLALLGRTTCSIYGQTVICTGDARLRTTICVRRADYLNASPSENPRNLRFTSRSVLTDKGQRLASRLSESLIRSGGGNDRRSAFALLSNLLHLYAAPFLRQLMH